MTSPYLISDLKMDEGFRARAYPDPLSGAEPWTVGYGATGPDIGPDTVWTEPQAADDLSRRAGALTIEMQETFAWFRGMPYLRQDCCVNLAYNVGFAGFCAFHQMITALAGGDYDRASEQMLDSRWAHQVPHRAARLATQMRTGVHA